LTAIAPGSGPGHPTGFQQRHAFAGERQAQCRVQTAETGADNQYFGVPLPVQCRSIDEAIGAGVGVIAGDMPGGLLKHKRLMKFYSFNFMKKYTMNFMQAMI
jgi:hypothetical protein